MAKINLSQRPGECEHKWTYGGATMWCELCGWYCQPDGRVTSTPSGKVCKVLETINMESVQEENDSGGKGFLVDPKLIDSCKVAIVPIDWPEGKLCPTQYNDEKKQIEYDRKNFNPKDDPNKWLIHERAHAILDAQGVPNTDPNVDYPKNKIEQGAFTTQFYYMIKSGVTLKDIETKPVFVEIKDYFSRHPITKQYWKTAENLIKVKTESVEELTEGIADVAKKFGKDYLTGGLVPAITKGVSSVMMVSKYKKSLANVQNASLIPKLSYLPGTNVPIRFGTGVMREDAEEIFEEGSDVFIESWEDIVNLFSNPNISERVIKQTIENMRRELGAEILFTKGFISRFVYKFGPAVCMQLGKQDIEFIKRFWGRLPLVIHPGGFDASSNHSKVILINIPSLRSKTFSVRTAEDLTLIIKHEYGHFMTWEKISLDDWADYILRKDLLAFPVLAKYGNDNQALLELQLYYWNLKPEKMANDHMNLTHRDLGMALLKKEDSNFIRSLKPALEYIVKTQFPSDIMQGLRAIARGKAKFDIMMRNIQYGKDLYKSCLDNATYRRVCAIYDASEKQYNLLHKLKMLESVEEFDESKLTELIKGKKNEFIDAGLDVADAWEDKDQRWTRYLDLDDGYDVADINAKKKYDDLRRRAFEMKLKKQKKDAIGNINDRIDKFVDKLTPIKISPMMAREGANVITEAGWKTDTGRELSLAKVPASDYNGNMESFNFGYGDLPADVQQIVRHAQSTFLAYCTQFTQNNMSILTIFNEMVSPDTTVGLLRAKGMDSTLIMGISKLIPLMLPVTVTPLNNGYETQTKTVEIGPILGLAFQQTKEVFDTAYDMKGLILILRSDDRAKAVQLVITNKDQTTSGKLWSHFTRNRLSESSDDLISEPILLDNFGKGGTNMESVITEADVDVSTLKGSGVNVHGGQKIIKGDTFEGDEVNVHGGQHLIKDKELDTYGGYSSGNNAKTKKVESMLTAIGNKMVAKEISINQGLMNMVTNAIQGSNALDAWVPGFKKVKFTLITDTKKDIDVEFVPSGKDYRKEFISRFINGKESLGEFLRRTPSLEVKFTEKFLQKLSKGSQLTKVVKAALRYYGHGINVSAQSMFIEITRLGAPMKELISTTPLSGLVTFPLSLLLLFDEIDPEDPKFGPNRETIDAVRRFIRMASTAPRATKEEQEKVIKDMKSAVSKVTRLSSYHEGVKDFQEMGESIQKLCEGGYADELDYYEAKWIDEQCEPGGIFVEAKRVKVKKLKKIPSDLVSYILIEGEAIRDANDKMLIISYAHSKLEIVEWYIELLEVGSKNYIVPHTKTHLEGVKRDLQAAIKKIMEKPIPKPSDPTVIVTYPPGYEG